MKKLIATGTAVLCFLLTGCMTTVRQDLGLYGKRIPAAEQSILIIRGGTYVTYVTGFDGDTVLWGRKHHTWDWATEVQIHIPSGVHTLTFKFNNGERVRLKNTLTKEFLPGHCYFLRITIPKETNKRTIIFTDWTKNSGSESFVEDEDGNWVIERP
jgi:hypothetical protein